MSALAFAVADLANDNGVFLTAGSVNHEFVFEFTFKNRGCEDRMLRVICVLVLIRVRQLLHAVKAPSKELTLVRDGETVPIPGDNLKNLLRNGDFLWYTMPNFVEGGHHLTVLCTLTALAECVIAHGPDLPIAIKHDQMVDTRGKHFHRW